MTLTEEAILHYKYGINYDIFAEPVTSYAQAAVVALEKRIPKCPVYDRIDRVYCCPVCKSSFTFYGAYRTFHTRPHFCDCCGQAIDWSDSHEIL